MNQQLIDPKNYSTTNRPLLIGPKERNHHQDHSKTLLNRALRPDTLLDPKMSTFRVEEIWYSLGPKDHNWPRNHQDHIGPKEH